MNKLQELFQINETIYKISLKYQESNDDKLYFELLQDYLRKEENIYDQISKKELMDMEKDLKKQYGYGFEESFWKILREAHFSFPLLRIYHGLISLFDFYDMQILSEFTRQELKEMKESKYALDLFQAEDHILQKEMQLLSYFSFPDSMRYCIINDKFFLEEKEDMPFQEGTLEVFLWENKMLRFLEKKESNSIYFEAMKSVAPCFLKERMDLIFKEAEKLSVVDPTRRTSYLKFLQDMNLPHQENYSIRDFAKLESLFDQFYFLHLEKWNAYEPLVLERSEEVPLDLKLCNSLREKEREETDFFASMSIDSILQLQEFINFRVVDKVFFPSNLVSYMNATFEPKNLDDFNAKTSFLHQSMKNYIQEVSNNLFGSVVYGILKIESFDLFQNYLPQYYMHLLRELSSRSKDPRLVKLYAFGYFLLHEYNATALFLKKQLPTYNYLPYQWQMQFDSYSEFYQSLWNYFESFRNLDFSQNDLEILSYDFCLFGAASVLKPKDQILFQKTFQKLYKKR